MEHHYGIQKKNQKTEKLNIFKGNEILATCGTRASNKRQIRDSESESQIKEQKMLIELPSAIVPNWNRNEPL